MTSLIAAPSPRTAPPRPRPVTAPAPPRRRLRTEAVWQVPVLAAMAALLLLGGSWHEPWFDEAQAWLIARDSSPWELLTTRLRHEGSPGLWHLLLMPFAHAGLPYRTVSVVAGVVTLAGAALFVRRAPFPAAVRALLPFSYFALYQYAVVARSYVLIAPLLWLAVLARPARLRSPLPFAVCLALLANVSLHGSIVAACWWGLHLLDVRRAWWRLDAATRRAHLVATAVVATAGLLVVATVAPTSDIQGGGGFSVRPVAMAHALGDVWMSLPCAPLLLAAMAVGCWWLRQARALALFALPAAALVVFFAVRYFSPWHAGLLPLLWLAALWASREEGDRRAWRSPAPWIAACCAAAVGLAAQVAWSGAALAGDRTSAYSAAGAAADLVRSEEAAGHSVLAMRTWTVALLPYFDHPPFADWHERSGGAFYPWSYSDWPFPDDLAVVAAHPDVIVFGVEVRSPRNVPCFDGYRLDRVLRGTVTVGGTPWETEDYVIYRRLDGPTPPRPGGAMCGVISPR